MGNSKAIGYGQSAEWHDQNPTSTSVDYSGAPLLPSYILKASGSFGSDTTPERHSDAQREQSVRRLAEMARELQAFAAQFSSDELMKGRENPLLQYDVYRLAQRTVQAEPAKERRWLPRLTGLFRKKTDALTVGHGNLVHEKYRALEAGPTNSFNYELHKLEEAVYAGELGAVELDDEEADSSVKFPAWPENRRNKPYEL